MIVVKLIGGLGNQMFQYAIGRRLALENQTELKLDIIELLDRNHSNYIFRDYELGVYNIKATLAQPKDLKLFFNASSGLFEKIIFRMKQKTLSAKIIYDDFPRFTPKALQVKKNTYLSGYWQSEKYFKEIADTIREDFSCKLPYKPENNLIISQIKTTTSVSLHVRRGDYVTNKGANEYHGVCSLQYYKEAIKRITLYSKSPTFFIFSDDPAWVKEAFEFLENKVIIDQNNKGFEDLRMMSACNHHIIANSSFSWWGAWLNENPQKIVIAPKKWFNNAEMDTSNLLPEIWIKI